LVTLLREAGASVSATDLDETSARPFVEELGAQWVAASSVYDVLCDIFSPCALGGVLNADTVQRLRCRIVAGSANNQLATPDDGIALRKRGILYVPDFVVNGGGVVNVAEEWAAGGYHQDRAFERIRDIGPLLTKIFQQAQRERVGPEQAAMTWARSRIVQLGQVKKTYVPG
jgi:leucine dehydrogenase